MAISVSCLCGRFDQIDAKHAGKSFRCRSCGENIAIPDSPAGASDETDSFDDWGDGQDFSAEEVVSAPPVRARRSSARRKRQGMPPGVIAAIVCEAILIPINLLYIVGNAARGELLELGFAALRIAFEVAVILCFFIGIVFYRIGLVVFLPQADIDRAARTASMILTIFEISLMIAIIAALLLAFSGDYFE